MDIGILWVPAAAMVYMLDIHNYVFKTFITIG